MIKKTLLTLTLATTFATTTSPMFEVGKIAAQDEEALIPYPGGDLYKLSSPKKVIIRRTS